MALLEQVKKNWAALAVIGGIVGGSIFGWNYLMDQVAQAADIQVKATINKEMIDGAKQAAKEAVKEIVPDVAKQAAREAVRELLQAQKAEKDATK